MCEVAAAEDNAHVATLPVGGKHDGDLIWLKYAPLLYGNARGIVLMSALRTDVNPCDTSEIGREADAWRRI